LSTPDDTLESFLRANSDAQKEMGIVPGGANPWTGSAFEWIKLIPSSRRRGKAGEVLSAAWLRNLGYAVGPPSNAGHDAVVAGHKVEIKFSTLWEAGEYVFQQLRDQDYEFAFLLGVSPLEAHAWLMPKAVAWNHAVPQHGGAAGSDTRWLRILAASPPSWMAPFGGSLADAEGAISDHLS
jgi:hypothetical protein